MKIKHLGSVSIEAALAFTAILSCLFFSLAIIDYFLLLRAIEESIEYEPIHFTGQPLTARSGAYFHSLHTPVTATAEARTHDRRISFGEAIAYDRSITALTDGIRTRLVNLFDSQALCGEEEPSRPCVHHKHYIEVRYGFVAIDRESGRICLDGNSAGDCGRHEGSLTRFSRDPYFNLRVTGLEPIRNVDMSPFVHGGRSLAYSGAYELLEDHGSETVLRRAVEQFVTSMNSENSPSPLAIPSGVIGARTFQFYGEPDGTILATEMARHREYLGFTPIVALAVIVDISEARSIRLLGSVPGAQALLSRHTGRSRGRFTVSRQRVWVPRRVM